MKRTLNVAIGGCSFTIDDDAYEALRDYLDRFKASLGTSSYVDEVMEELEMRIADLLKEKLQRREVVDITIVESVLDQIGPVEDNGNKSSEQDFPEHKSAVRKFYCSTEGKYIAGVCSGLALYLNIDVTLVRILFLVALICGTAGFWTYIVLWIAAPEARTAVEKCELRGIPATAENIRKFTENR